MATGDDVWACMVRGRVANLDFIDDDSSGECVDFSLIGYDVLQVEGGTIVDPRNITDGVAEVDLFVAKTKAEVQTERTIIDHDADVVTVMSSNIAAFVSYEGFESTFSSPPQPHFQHTKTCDNMGELTCNNSW